MKGYAAVAVITTRAGDILFIRRRVNPRDPWSGDIAFPGGRKINSDRHLLDTVYREVYEEVGIRLDKFTIEPIVLGVFNPMSYPDYKVYAYLIWMDHKYPVSPGDEVDEVIWLSIDSLVKGRCTRYLRILKVVREVDCFKSNGIVIWGLTYRILNRFLHRFYDRE